MRWSWLNLGVDPLISLNGEEGRYQIQGPSRAPNNSMTDFRVFVFSAADVNMEVWLEESIDGVTWFPVTNRTPKADWLAGSDGVVSAFLVYSSRENGSMPPVYLAVAWSGQDIYEYEDTGSYLCQANIHVRKGREQE